MSELASEVPSVSYHYEQPLLLLPDWCDLCNVALGSRMHFIIDRWFDSLARPLARSTACRSCSPAGSDFYDDWSMFRNIQRRINPGQSTIAAVASHGRQAPPAMPLALNDYITYWPEAVYRDSEQFPRNL